MFEFKINQRQKAMTFSELNMRSKKSVSQTTSTNTNKPGTGTFSVQFNNMFTNIQNAKSGCRSCRGTY